MKNLNITTAESQSPVWIVAVEFVEAPELVERTRDSDGRFLKVNIDLNVQPVAKFNDALAGRSDYDDSDCLFAARR